MACYKLPCEKGLKVTETFVCIFMTQIYISWLYPSDLSTHFWEEATKQRISFLRTEELLNLQGKGFQIK